jgi:reverse gyrase
VSKSWDVRQTVRTIAEDIVRIRYQETTNEDVEDFICAAVR